MKLLLIRHGQTDLNVQKRLQGSSNTPLNERGRQQARETHEFLQKNNLIPTKVFSSPLDRAIETGAIVAGIDKSQIEIIPELIEMGFGIYEHKNMDEENPQFLDECFGHPETYIPPEGGESYDHVLTRVERAIESMRSRIYAGEFADDDIVMLVSHGATSHGIFEYISGTDRARYWDVDFNNCAIVELHLSQDGSADSYEFVSKGFEKNW